MSAIKVRVIRIGDSKAVLLPAGLLALYGIGEMVSIEERSDGLLLRATTTLTVKTTWDETAGE